MIEDWLETDMITFLEREIVHEESVVPVRAEDAGLMYQNHRWTEEITMLLKRNDVAAAKQLFTLVRARYESLPVEHIEERTKLYETVQECYLLIANHQLDRWHTMQVLHRMDASPNDVFDANVQPVNLQQSTIQVPTIPDVVPLTKVTLAQLPVRPSALPAAPVQPVAPSATPSVGGLPSIDGISMPSPPIPFAPAAAMSPAFSSASASAVAPSTINANTVEPRPTPNASAMRDDGFMSNPAMASMASSSPAVTSASAPALLRLPSARTRFAEALRVASRDPERARDIIRGIRDSTKVTPSSEVTEDMLVALEHGLDEREARAQFLAQCVLDLKLLPKLAQGKNPVAIIRAKELAEKLDAYNRAHPETPSVNMLRAELETIRRLYVEPLDRELHPVVKPMSSVNGNDLRDMHEPAVHDARDANGKLTSGSERKTNLSSRMAKEHSSSGEHVPVMTEARDATMLVFADAIHRARLMKNPVRLRAVLDEFEQYVSSLPDSPTRDILLAAVTNARRKYVITQVNA